MLTRRLIESSILHNEWFRNVVPTRLKELMKARIPYAEYRSEQLRREAEAYFGGPIPRESYYDSEYNAVLGIFFDKGYAFVNNIVACHEMKIRYKVIDIASNDWIRRIELSKCDGFLASPDNLLCVWRKIYEERLWVASQCLHLKICPTFGELFLWESKRRMRDWLVANGVPHPETWVFTEQSEALKYCLNASYPIVCKTDIGAASNGVFVLRDRHMAEKMVAEAFKNGILPRSTDARDREWGSILLQKYVPHSHEWRIVRIGDDYLCRLKEKKGDFASGSGKINYATPTLDLLNFVRRITDISGFKSMAVDVFVKSMDCSVDSNTPFLVNELQAIIGAKEIQLNNHAGRWQYSCEGESWSFHRGDYYRNACANLRVMMLLKCIGAT